MSKKWLYSVALGALLVAGNAAGITVHDVLSHDFWAKEQRASYDYLDKMTDHKYKTSYIGTKCKEKPEEIKWTGTVIRSGPTINGIRWRDRQRYKVVETKPDRTEKEKETLTSKREYHKEKIKEQRYWFGLGSEVIYSNTWLEAHGTYKNKPRTEDARPIGPFVVEDWFPERMYDWKFQDCQFFGTEENAVTNIISDNEAYITRTISQTGHIDSYMGIEVNEDSSLLRNYNTHITTDADHVYVEQEITENTVNDQLYISKNTWQTQYTLTYKKGRWKDEKEIISKVSTQKAAEWARKGFEDKAADRAKQDGAKVAKVASRFAQRTKDMQNYR